MSTAKEWKDKGNLLVQERKYGEALECYSKAIELDPNDPILYSNRSAMYFNCGDYDNAIYDAEEAIRLKPDYAKAYLRKGNALEKKQRYQEALSTYKIGLEKDSNNKQLLEAFQNLDNLLQSINNNQHEIKDINDDRNLIEKYALKKNVKIYFLKQISDKSTLKGIIEEVKDGLIYFQDEHNKFHILNIQNIIDIKII